MPREGDRLKMCLIDQQVFNQMISNKTQPHILLGREHLALANLSNRSIDAIFRREQRLILCGMAYEGDQVSQFVVVGLPEIIDTVLLGLSLKLRAQFCETTRIELLRSVEEDRQCL